MEEKEIESIKVTTARDIEKKLTNRQWVLIGLLTKASLESTMKWVSQDEIIAAYPYNHDERKDGYKISTNPKAHDKCTAIWSDINAINHSMEFNHIVIYDNFEAKLGTREEAEEYIGEFYHKGILAIKRARNLEYKLGLNNQGKLLSNQLREITEDSKANRFVESVVEPTKGE